MYQEGAISLRQKIILTITKIIDAPRSSCLITTKINGCKKHAQPLQKKIKISDEFYVLLQRLIIAK